MDERDSPGSGARPERGSDDLRIRPDVDLLSRIRALVTAAIIVGVTYTLLTSGSRGLCVGGTDADGGFVDSSRNATDAAPTCVTLVLGPNPLMYLVFAAIVIAALTRMRDRAHSEVDAIRIIRRAAFALAVVGLASVVIAQVWVGLIPLQDWTASGYSFVYPFPFGSVELSINPVSAP